MGRFEDSALLLWEVAMGGEAAMVATLEVVFVIFIDHHAQGGTMVHVTLASHEIQAWMRVKR